MILRQTKKGFLVGALVGSALSFYFSHQHFEQELENNLSKNVVKAQIVESQPYDSSEIAVPEDIAEDKAFIMVYADYVGGHSYKLPVSAKDYFKFKHMRHKEKDIADLRNWVTYNDEIVKKNAEFMTKDVGSLEEKAKVLLDFVHSHIYDARIEEQGDYVRYPVETMVERNGDCEDLAILGAALMKAVGLDVALVYFPPQKGENAGHIGLGVHGDFSGAFFNVDGKKYFYAETTGTDWLTRRSYQRIGAMSPDFFSKHAEIYVIK